MEQDIIRVLRIIEYVGPRNFRQNRCFRTLKNLHPDCIRLEPEFQGRRHYALDDAMHQTKWLHSILNLLEGYYTPWPI